MLRSSQTEILARVVNAPLKSSLTLRHSEGIWSSGGEQNLIKEDGMSGYVGPRVRERREELGLTRHELAQLAQVPAARLRLWEGGLERVPAGHLLRMARVLSVTLVCLFSRSELVDSARQGRRTF
jgi:ribosome-binding protein aMBF1 (putative translation factor)